MNPTRDPDRLIHAFMLEGAEQLHDQVYDAVRADIEHRHQRVFIGPWRLPTMNKFLPIGLGAAAVVVALVVGIQLLGPRGPAGPGGVPSVVPSPTPLPTAAPSSSSPDASLPEGPLLWIPRNPPVDPLAITVDIPAEGWTKHPEFGALNKGTDVGNLPESAVLGGSLVEPVFVYGDPCDWQSTMPDSPATTVDQVVAALAAQASRDASEPVDVTIGGYTGKRITLHVPEDADFEACDDAEFVSFGYGNTREQVWRWHQGPGQIDDLWFVDVDGTIVVIDAMYRADTPFANIEEMREIAESATFGE